MKIQETANKHHIKIVIQMSMCSKMLNILGVNAIRHKNIKKNLSKN